MKLRILALIIISLMMACTPAQQAQDDMNEMQDNGMMDSSEDELARNKKNSTEKNREGSWSR